MRLSERYWAVRLPLVAAFSGTLLAAEFFVAPNGLDLFDRCRWNFLKPYALVAYWKPHTAELGECKVITYGYDRYLNNVFSGGGLERLPVGPGVQADWNVFQGGAKPSPWDDRHSVVLPESAAALEFVSRPGGVDLRIPPGAAARRRAPVGVPAGDTRPDRNLCPDQPRP